MSRIPNSTFSCSFSPALRRSVSTSISPLLRLCRPRPATPTDAQVGGDIELDRSDLQGEIDQGVNRNAAQCDHQQREDQPASMTPILCPWPVKIADGEDNASEEQQCP